MTAEDYNKQLSAEEFAAGKTVLSCVPHYYILESWNYCNLDCVMCIEHGHPSRRLIDKERPKVFPRLFLEKLENFLSKAYYCNFEGYGEPFLSQPFWDMVKYTCDVSATKDFPKIYVASNGNITNPEEALKKAMHPWCKTITFSVQAASPEMYHNIMGGDFETARKTIFKFMEMRDALGLDIPVYINHLLMRSTIHELPALVRTFCENPNHKIDVFKTIALKDMGPSFTNGWVRKRESGFVFDYKNEVLTPESIGEAQHYYDEAKRIAEENGVRFWGAPIFERLPYQENTGKKGLCPYPWEFFQVLTSGDVMPCLYLQNKPIGNLNDQTPEEIWNGEEYQKLRSQILEGKTPDRCQGCLCPYTYDYE